MHKSGEIIAELLENDLHTTDTETTIELNSAVLKFRHLIKKIQGVKSGARQPNSHTRSIIFITK